MLQKLLRLLLPVVVLISAGVFADNKNAQTDIQNLISQAEQGDTKAQYDLAFRLEMGIDIDKDCEKAVYWYTKAAKEGLAAAQFSLGYLYNEGLGVKQDYKKAHQWYEKANNQGLAEAKYAIGALYYNGEGVEQDYRMAKKWFGEACDAGEAQSCEQYRQLNAIGI